MPFQILDKIRQIFLYLPVFDNPYFLGGHKYFTVVLGLIWTWSHPYFFSFALKNGSLLLIQPCTTMMNYDSFRAVFKWLSKVITWLRLLRFVIGLKNSRQLFNQWESKPKTIAPCTHDFSRASSEWQAIARNSDWFMALFVPVVIG